MTEQMGGLGEHGPERILTREEILNKIRSYCEDFAVERELTDDAGIYLLEVIAADNNRRYAFQRRRLLPGAPRGVESARTTVRVEFLDWSFYPRTLADFDPVENKWVEQPED